MKLATLSSKQLAAVAMTGAALVYTSAWMTVAPLPAPVGAWLSFPTFLWAFRNDILLIFMPLLTGGALALRAASAFEKNIRNDQWPEASIVPLRAQVNRPIWTAITSLGALAGFVLIIISPLSYINRSHGHHHPEAFTYLFVVPMVVLGRLRAALRPPREAKRPEWLHQELAPLTSSHWGQTPQTPLTERSGR